MLEEPYLVPSIKTGIQKQEPALFSLLVKKEPMMMI